MTQKKFFVVEFFIIFHGLDEIKFMVQFSVENKK